MNIRQKLPGRWQLVQVFAVASVMIYGWTTYRLIQKLPSWLLYLNAREILANYSHALVFNFLEVLLFTGLVLIINILLPARLFMEKFVACGSLFSIFSLGYLIYLALAIGRSKASQFPSATFNWMPLVFLVILLLSVFLPRVELIQKVTDDFADRVVIFLYILLPITGLGILLFLFNNLF